MGRDQWGLKMYFYDEEGNVICSDEHEDQDVRLDNWENHLSIVDTCES